VNEERLFIVPDELSRKIRPEIEHWSGRSFFMNRFKTLLITTALIMGSSALATAQEWHRDGWFDHDRDHHRHRDRDRDRRFFRDHDRDDRFFFRDRRWDRDDHWRRDRDDRWRWENRWRHDHDRDWDWR